MEKDRENRVDSERDQGFNILQFICIHISINTKIFVKIFFGLLPSLFVMGQLSGIQEGNGERETGKGQQRTRAGIKLGSLV